MVIQNGVYQFGPLAFRPEYLESFQQVVLLGILFRRKEWNEQGSGVSGFSVLSISDRCSGWSFYSLGLSVRRANFINQACVPFSHSE
ncbi:hypothetical protein AVEN_141601-1 [Araneus ventricosus]|uniref:Uncharacterized protein n=1 Tax=Araneus ventricosus TaxID=182803 RepID=A0A4Y2ILL8_ARAVE|nr:hypothetical protein AVEN_141601-1 [Araneus ventricosus]